VEDILGDLDDFDLELEGVDSSAPIAIKPKPKPPKHAHDVVGEELMTEETLGEGTITGHAREVNHQEPLFSVKQGFGGGIDLPAEKSVGGFGSGAVETIETMTHATVEKMGTASSITTMAADEAGDEWDMTETALGRIDTEVAVVKKQHDAEAEAAVTSLGQPASASASASFQGIPDLETKLDTLFKKMDRDGSGTIERNEIKSLVIALGLASGIISQRQTLLTHNSLPTQMTQNCRIMKKIRRWGMPIRMAMERST
jgi:hypothetical protein